MSSRRTKPQPLSDIEIREITTAVEEGRPPRVWFTSDAVGVPEGQSGKVVALGDPSEGDFLRVRPTGSKDVLPFSPTEVTVTKPPKKSAANTPSASSVRSANRKDTAVSSPSTATPSPRPPGYSATSGNSATPDNSATASNSTPPGSTTASGPARKQSAAPGAGRAPAESNPDANSGAAKTAKPSQGSRPARDKGTGARKPRTPEVTVTLSGTADGEWTVDMVHGKKRTRGLSVPGATVAQAAKLLHPEVAEVVEAVLESVRNTQRVKVEQLQAELEQARRVLDDLSG